ncbi:MAG TPA: hypothetical protein VH370_12920 [Humisphaera sp.]|jgi:hypothetical protein|nr:hypothetical protein [Humisphaera sp.]
MKHLQRIARNVAAILWLLLCVSVAALWVRSYWVEDTVVFAYDPVNQLGRDVYLISVSGRAELQISWAGPQFRGTKFNRASEKGELPTTDDVDGWRRDEAMHSTVRTGEGSASPDKVRTRM